MEREDLTTEKKRKQLYLKQKELLGMFLERGAISYQQYEKSLGDLTVKMGFGTENDAEGRKQV